jgi:riboflavin kinase / FMN adenylyltransferase
VQIKSSLDNLLTPTAIALGNFDGIHRGHLEVIKPVLELDAPDCYKTVVTFDPHPQEYFTGQQRQLLTPQPEKAIILEKLGIQQLVLLPFDRELVKLSPQEFVTQILNDRLQSKFVSVGEDFRFGNQRAGMATDLQLTQALLGRAYSIVGTVINGQEIGRSIGFPTANLKYPPEKFLPRQGVYCVRVDTATQQQLPGVMNIGKRPTVDGVNTNVEVHLLDWDGNLYGQQLTIYLHQFLRSEQKFPDLTALTNQIQSDCDTARIFFKI